MHRIPRWVLSLRQKLPLPQWVSMVMTLVTVGLVTSTYIINARTRADLNVLRDRLDVLRTQRDQAIAVMQDQQHILHRIEGQRDAALLQRDELAVQLRQAQHQCERHTDL